MNLIPVSIFLLLVGLIFHSSISNAQVAVYDNNDQYLGILMELDDDEFEVFIPSLETSWNHSRDEDDLNRESAYFESSDCTGTPYSNGPFPRIHDLTASSVGGYHKPNYSGKKTITPASMVNGDNGQCQQISGTSAEYYPLTEVDMPFTTPIALPLKYNIDSEYQRGYEAGQAACGSSSQDTTQIEAFITRFYSLCLGRTPDQTGLDGWVNYLVDGTMTGAQVAYSFVFSPEFLDMGKTDAEYLQVLYEAFFNRQPDSAGYNSWIQNMTNGMSRLEILNGFTGAQEFLNLCEDYGITAQ